MKNVPQILEKKTFPEQMTDVQNQGIDKQQQQQHCEFMKTTKAESNKKNAT